MKFAAAALLGAASAIEMEVENSYLAYVAEHGKSYGTEEEFKFRLNLYAQKVAFVREHNANVIGNDATVGINHMADWTDAEYKRLLGYRTRPQAAKAAETFTGDVTTAPDSIDWRAKGAVTAPKNQGQCGSCWAFSTTGSMEGRYQIAGNKLTSFSEQQFVDCSTSFGNAGCQGGLMDDAFKYAEGVAIDTEADYGYTGRNGTCHAKAGVTEVKSFSDVKTKSADALKAAVAEGPVSVAIDAAGIGFQLYFGGIMKHFCGTSLDHGVLVVGYGTDKGEDFWLLKNSWGGSWGEKGYFRIFRDQKSTDAGVCGLQLQPSFPLF
jgi:C1A family cysteine protease